MTITFNKTTIDSADNFYYDPISDRINMEFLVDDISEISDVVLDPKNLDEISTETDIYNGYNKLHNFSTMYEIPTDKYRCYISLETDMSTYEKMMKRIEELEEASKEQKSSIESINNLTKSLFAKGDAVIDKQDISGGDIS